MYIAEQITKVLLHKHHQYYDTDFCLCVCTRYMLASVQTYRAYSYTVTGYVPPMILYRHAQMLTQTPFTF